jgi:hypothetical protein
MELSSSVFTEALSPLAPYVEAPTTTDEHTAQEINWETSSCNPQSRIDSFEPSSLSTWRIDGATFDGRQFFAVPLFALGKPPLRVDVQMPPIEEFPPSMRAVLRPETAIFTRRTQIADLDISRYLLRALTTWSANMTDFEAQYLELYFGSHIVVRNIQANFRNTEIHMLANFKLEQQMLAVETLQKRWSKIPPTDWPEMVDWADLRFERQIHENISLVRYKSQTVVFKSLTRDTSHLYRELKMLLSLRRHPNVMPRPIGIVQWRVRFGGKKGVCGFLLEYFPAGDLEERLRGEVAYRDALRWAWQITDALIHVNSEGGFYPDLKLDNIVLRECNGSTDAVLLDFEQRGGWYSWSPPEVLYTEYLETLSAGLKPSRFRRDVRIALESYIPAGKLPAPEQMYQSSEGEFSRAWLALVCEPRDSSVLEKAQVFMLGKLLWCIMEGQTSIRCGLDHETLRDSEPDSLAFPQFKLSPVAIRDLVRRCTLGAPEWQGRQRPVVLRGGRLQTLVREDIPATGDITLAVINDWWRAEVEAALAFVRHRVANRHEIPEEIQRRPTLVQVSEELRKLGRL